MAGPHRFEGLQDRINKWQEIFNLIRARADHNDREPLARQRGPPGYPLVDRQQNIVACSLSGDKQLAITLALEACPFDCVRIMFSKAMTEVEWQTLIQQDLHSIPASREFLASSSA